MCAINGIFAYHAAAGAPDEAECLRTRDAMQARGPDGFGIWWSRDQRCVLGNRRLSIIDLSERALQPMVSDDRKLAITFNGEIYNYQALRDELEAGGVRFRTTSDTEVVLRLYARYGADMVRRLRGMFAFAIWDEERRGLFLARDPYGIKPLYTANDGWTFRFGSQVKALLAGRAVSRDPEPAGVVGFQLFGSVPEPFTLYRDIRALPAGHVQWIDGVGPHEPEPFSRLAPILADGAAHPPRADDVRDVVRAAVFDSVRAHLVADVDVGVFLSSGIDSSALLGLIHDTGRRDVCAITVSFEEFSGTQLDEVAGAKAIAERYGARHTIRTVTRREFEDDLPAITAAMDQPTIDGINTWFVAKAARETGLKVALSGLGGDELLAGYPSFLDLPRWRSQLGTIPNLPGLGRVTRLLLRKLAPRLAEARPKALGMLEFAGSWSGAYLLRRGLFLPAELSEMMEPVLVKEGLRRLKPLQRLSEELLPDPGSDIGRVCALESAHYMRNQLLRDADWAGMAHSIEIRVPLVDETLIKAIAPILPNLAPGIGKLALANAPSLPLPHATAAREKTGFVVPIGQWLGQPEGAVAARHATGLASRRWSQTLLENFLPTPGFAAA
jgi:asparagine synthase (glutamine-hydrolysing)